MPKRYRPRVRTTPKPFTKDEQGRVKERFNELRDDDLRAWIRQQPCAVASPHCRYERTAEGYQSDPEHVSNKARGTGDAGQLIPLCRKHHTERHTHGPKDFQREYKTDMRELAGEYQLRYEQARGAPTL